MKKFIKESNHFLKIGIPILGSQLSYMIMYTTDTIVATLDLMKNLELMERLEK